MYIKIKTKLPMVAFKSRNNINNISLISLENAANGKV